MLRDFDMLVSAAIENETKITSELNKCLLVWWRSLELDLARIILLKDTVVAQAHRLHELWNQLFLGAHSFRPDLDANLFSFLSCHVLVIEAPVKGNITCTF